MQRGREKEDKAPTYFKPSKSQVVSSTGYWGMGRRGPWVESMNFLALKPLVTSISRVESERMHACLLL